MSHTIRFFIIRKKANEEQVSGFRIGTTRKENRGEQGVKKVVEKRNGERINVGKKKFCEWYKRREKERRRKQKA